MVRINIKPLSVNKAWQGKRYKTPEYNKYENTLLFLLPKNLIIPKQIEVRLLFGFTNLSSDLDNPVKLILDIMQKKYGFNDSHIYRLVVDKEKAKQDFFEFEIKEYIK